MSKLLNTIIVFLIIAVMGVAVYLLFFNNEIHIKKIILDKNEISIFIKDKNIIIPSILPKDATNKTIIWASKDEKIAMVDENGVVSAVSDGETDIIASSKDGEVTAVCHVKVFVREVKKIELTETNLKLKIGEKKRIYGTTLPRDATNPKLVYRSTNEDVVKVDSNGNIVANKSGTAEIIVNDERKKAESRCKVNVYYNGIAVDSISLDKTITNLKPGDQITLNSTISPSDAGNIKVRWESTDSNILAITQDGKVTAKNSGVATISVITEDGNKTATCVITVRTNPIIPSTSSHKYEGISLKYYIQNNKSYYLTYIWMEDPYNQIKKLDAMTSFHSKIMTDEEMEKEGKKPFRRTVGQMLTSYISNGMIPTSKSVVAFNASGFFVKGAWEPPSDYYHNRSDGWLVINEGKITRNKITDPSAPNGAIIGIDAYGNLKIYDANTEEERQETYNKILSDKVKNTFSFNPKLVVDGKNVIKNDVKAQRQAICQIDSNNYLMLTSISPLSLTQVADVFVKNKCVTGFNLDGGGSTSFFYKNAGSKSVTKVKCSDSNNSSCRQVVEGIYFIDK